MCMNVQQVDLEIIFVLQMLIFSGQPPYNPDLFRTRGLSKPQPLKERALPGPLSMVGCVNKVVLLSVINFDPLARCNAAAWLEKLSGYEIRDGS